MGKVDVAFGLSGDKIPADHGYSLYAAISRILPHLHPPAAALETKSDGALWREVGIHPINGRPCGNRLLAIHGATRLRIRIDQDHVDGILPLTGQKLELDGSMISVGAPAIELLVPSACVRSRLVIIKGFLEPIPFLDAVGRQLQELRIAGQPAIPYRRSAEPSNEKKSPLLRRTLQIRDKVVVGFALEINALTAEEAVILQEHGVGGRRRFGCGIFVPA